MRYETPTLRESAARILLVLCSIYYLVAGVLVGGAAAVWRSALGCHEACYEAASDWARHDGWQWSILLGMSLASVAAGVLLFVLWPRSELRMRLLLTQAGLLLMAGIGLDSGEYVSVSSDLALLVVSAETAGLLAVLVSAGPDLPRLQAWSAGVRDAVSPRLWVRVLFVHPVALVLPAVVLSYSFAQQGESRLEEVGLMLLLLASAPLVSALLTYVALRNWLLPRHARGAFAALSFVAGLAVAFGGFFLWYDAIEIACEGRYECPL